MAIPREMFDFLKGIKSDVDAAQVERSTKRVIEFLRRAAKAFTREQAANLLAVGLFTNDDNKAELTIDQIRRCVPLAFEILAKNGLYPRRRRRAGNSYYVNYTPSFAPAA